MKIRWLRCDMRYGAKVLLLLIVGGLVLLPQCQGNNKGVMAQDKTTKLTVPRLDGSISVEAALANRRSRRTFSGAASLDQLAQLLWAAQGVTDDQYGHRTAPSAGGLRPLEVYLLAVQVEGLEPGVYHYDPASHALKLHLVGNRRAVLAKAALGQGAIENAPAVLIFTAVYERTRVKYGDRASRYVHMEVGAAAENVYLQAESLGLATVFIGAFNDDDVSRVLDLPNNHAPLALLPAGLR